MNVTDLSSHPTLAEIEETQKLIAPHVRVTPTWELQDTSLNKRVQGTIHLKLELFQRTGTFKPRGAISVLKRFTPEDLACGVTAASGGNHAVALSYAAREMKTSAKVVMAKTASPLRIAKSRSYGAEVILTENIQEAFAEVDRIRETEGRKLVHPFEGKYTACGTGTLGMEFLKQIPELEAVVVSIGGGGLAGGLSAAIKQMNPGCKIFGVEPVGADAMYRSFQSGVPETLEKLDTIADSLGSPYSLPYSFSLCRKFVDEVVLVSDEEMKSAMRFGIEELKLALEPASAAPFSALFGPLADKVQGMKIGVIVCGSNMDTERFVSQVRA